MRADHQRTHLRGKFWKVTSNLRCARSAPRSSLKRWRLQRDVQIRDRRVESTRVGTRAIAGPPSDRVTSPWSPDRRPLSVRTFSPLERKTSTANGVSLLLNFQAPKSDTFPPPRQCATARRRVLGATERKSDTQPPSIPQGRPREEQDLAPNS